jgi:glycosyltransferase involved in cell wall biosynthesis
MKVLTVLNWLNRGGIETMLLFVVPELKSRGIHLDFCCLGGPGALDDRFRDLGCQLFHFPRQTAWQRGEREVRQVLAREHYDVVHSHFGYTSTGIARAARAHGKPMVVSVHNMGPAMKLASVPVARTLRRVWLDWHRRHAAPLVDLYLGVASPCLTSAVPDWTTRGPQCRVLHNGVRFPAHIPDRSEARQRLKIDNNTPCLLHVGSYRHEKNHDGLLEIHRRVLEREPRAKLLLVGDGPRRPVLQEQVDAGPLGDSVLFLGSQDDVWPFYAAADVFVFPSFSEGSPNSLTEAIGSGLPIVASRIPSHVEAVPVMQSGFLFDIPDYQQAADLVLAQLQSNRPGKTAAVCESKEFVRQRFSLSRHVDELAGLYESLVKPAVRRAA